jgi:hypothetical protein
VSKFDHFIEGVSRRYKHRVQSRKSHLPDARSTCIKAQCVVPQQSTSPHPLSHPRCPQLSQFRTTLNNIPTSHHREAHHPRRFRHCYPALRSAYSRNQRRLRLRFRFAQVLQPPGLGCARVGALRIGRQKSWRFGARWWRWKHGYSVNLEARVECLRGNGMYGARDTLYASVFHERKGHGCQ